MQNQDSHSKKYLTGYLCLLCRYEIAWQELFKVEQQLCTQRRKAGLSAFWTKAIEGRLYITCNDPGVLIEYDFWESDKYSVKNFKFDAKEFERMKNPFESSMEEEE